MRHPPSLVVDALGRQVLSWLASIYDAKTALALCKSCDHPHIIDVDVDWQFRHFHILICEAETGVSERKIAEKGQTTP